MSQILLVLKMKILVNMYIVTLKHNIAKMSIAITTASAQTLMNKIYIWTH